MKVADPPSHVFLKFALPLFIPPTIATTAQFLWLCPNLCFGFGMYQQGTFALEDIEGVTEVFYTSDMGDGCLFLIDLEKEFAFDKTAD